MAGDVTVGHEPADNGRACLSVAEPVNRIDERRLVSGRSRMVQGTSVQDDHLATGTTSAATREDRDSGVRAAQSLGGAWIVGRKNGQARIALLELPDHCRRPMKLGLVANAGNPARLKQL